MPYTWFKGNLFCRIQSPGRACFLKDGSSDKRVNIAQNWYVFVESSTELQKCVGDIQLFAFTEIENTSLNIILKRYDVIRRCHFPFPKKIKKLSLLSINHIEETIVN